MWAVLGEAVGRREKNKAVNPVRDKEVIKTNPGNWMRICNLGSDDT